MIRILTLVILSGFIALFFGLPSCKEKVSNQPAFNGPSEAVRLANEMYDAIGGTSRWCNLRSLYIKARHTEPQMVIPYTSEIWRGIDRFELVIEQQNDSFHVKGIFDQSEGRIHYLDTRDTFRILTPEQLKEFEFDHNHNIYVILHDMACHPDSFEVKIDTVGRLSFFKDNTFVTSFGLDQQTRPHLFYHPLADGTVVGSIFTHWGTDEGLVHSAGGHPLDSNFTYRTQTWLPSGRSLRETFGDTLFKVVK